MAGHTPGPWVWEPNGYGYSALWNAETRAEVLVPSGFNDGDSPVTWMGEEMSEADARLIAASPKTLEALEALLDATETLLSGVGMIRGKTPEDDDLHIHERDHAETLQEAATAARAAIAAAKGEA